MRIPAVACVLTLAAGCAQPININDVKPKLKAYLTEVMRTHGCSAIHTDEDSRARAPTKFADATVGLAFTIRHTVTIGGTPATISTWAFHTQAARDASKSGPFGAITDELSKAGIMFKVYAMDAGDLHLLFLMESKEMSPSNQFQLIFKEISAHGDDILK
jgi:hypothetical protein